MLWDEILYIFFWGVFWQPPNDDAVVRFSDIFLIDLVIDSFGVYSEI